VGGMGFRRKLWAVLFFCVLTAPGGAQNNAFPASGQEATVSEDSAGPINGASSLFSPCSVPMTERDAKRCILGSASMAPVPNLDPKHVYSLSELIDIAESASPEGRIAWQEAKRSLERLGSAQAAYLPLLTFMAEGRDLRAIQPFPEPLAPRGYVTVEEPLATAQLQLEYTLLDFGRGATVDASRAVELASTLHLSRIHQTIAYNTSTRYYQTQEAVAHLTAAQTILQTAETLSASAQAQYDHGRATLPDVQNAQAGEAKARYDLASAEADVEESKLTLTESIGVEPTTEIDIQPQQQGRLPDTIQARVQDLIHLAWKFRPDLLARAQDLRQARDARRTAHAAWLPHVELSAAGGQTAVWPSTDFGHVGSADVSTWSVSAGIKWDVFDGARRHDVNAALADQRAAAERQRAAQDAVTRQVWGAYVDYQTAVEQQQSAQSFLEAAQTSYDSSLDAYRYGVRSLVDVVQSEGELAQARLAAVSSYEQLMQSSVALSYATGVLSQLSAPSRVKKP
jgi:outer membrane protein